MADTEVLVGEAARILRISANHVRYLERTGQLRCRRIGTLRIFNKKDVELLAEDRFRRATGATHWRLDGTL
jgi:DNA-binding transcriptional MerR regulator